MALTPIRQMDLSIHGKMLSVIESLLADSAVSTDKIAASAVVESKIAASAVSTDKLAANAVTEAKIAANTITNASIAQTASISDAALDVISSAGKVANSATSAASANTADAIVARDANGGFSAGDVNVVDLSASGDLSVTGSSALTGDLNVNAGKLVVTAASGALDMDGALSVGGNATLSGDLLLDGDASMGGTLAVAGDLSVDTNKFTVAAATGNTIVGGTLSVSGESTLTGNVLASADVTIQGNLTVNGTTTSVNSIDLVVNDKLIHLNEPSVLGANDPVPTGLAGISIHRGSDAGVEREHAGMVWDEAGQKFVFQLLDADAAGSAKLSIEALNIEAQVFNGSSLNLETSSLIGTMDLQASVDYFTVDLASGTDNTFFRVGRNEFHVERSADDYATYSQFDIDVDGVRLRDEAGAELLPTLDSHLVVKKYVDDADAGLQDSVDELYDKSGIVAGTQNTYSTTNVVANGDSLLAAIGKIDDALADVAGKSYHEAFIYEAVGGETSLNKPVAAPAIPDSAFTEVYIDGRKVFRGADKQFTVAVGGGSIDFAALTAGQTVELRYFA